MNFKAYQALIRGVLKEPYNPLPIVMHRQIQSCALGQFSLEVSLGHKIGRHFILTKVTKPHDSHWFCFELLCSYGIHNTDLNDVMRPWEREQFPTKDISEEAGKNLSYDSRFPLQVLNKEKEDSIVHHGDNGDITFLQ